MTRFATRTLALVAVSLLGLGTAVPAVAASTDTITGRVVLPAGAPSDLIYVEALATDDTGEWVSSRVAQVGEDRTFTLSGLEPSTPYRLQTFHWLTGYVNGVYAGPGRGLVATFDEGADVYVGDVVELALVKKVPMHGTVSLPEGFPENVAVTIVGYELSPDGSDTNNGSVTSVTGYPGGSFTLPGVRPGGHVFLYVKEAFARSDPHDVALEPGYFHAGVTGLVADLTHATPVSVDSVPHVTVGWNVVAPRLSAIDGPRLEGDARVGGKLSASVAWSLYRTSTTYQWLRDGKPIPGATSASYNLGADDAQSRVAVRVTGSRSDFEPVSVASPAVLVPAMAAPRASVAPTLSGSARLGSTLTAEAGTWNVAGVAVTYQWLRDGRPISGATAPGLTLTTADVGSDVSMRVTATKAGHGEGVASSSAVKVAKGKPKVSAKITNLKKAKAGKRAKVRVRVKAAGLAKPRGTVIVKYGKKKIKIKLAAKRKGKVTVRLPKLRNGKHKIKVTYKPTGSSKKYLTKAASKKVTLRVK